MNDRLLWAFDALTLRLNGRVMRRIVDLARSRIGGTKGEQLVASTRAEVVGSDIVVVMRGVPALFNDGLGPGGRGTSGPFDMRRFVLRGKKAQAVPVAPGVFRMMSAKGRSWMHPGFNRADILRIVRSELQSLLREAFRDR
ncbi:MAG TPA: hypothetical protein PK095_00480 [Myxococcota bacterium]|nr:hypothetical protein [Myxococcota bacterium]